MNTKSRPTLAAALAGMAAALVLGAGAATADAATTLAGPAHDAFADAVEIQSLPFGDSVDLNGATTEPGEPQACNFQAQSVWYRLSPAAAVTIDLAGSDFGVVLNVYQSFGGLGSLGFRGCLGHGGSMQLQPEAGGTYYIQAGSVSPGPARLALSVRPVPPPDNDAFADAKPVNALPYVDHVDLTAATLEPGEPTSPPGSSSPLAGSAWYAFTPAVSGSYTLTPLGCCVTTSLTPYLGTAVDGLAPVSAFTTFGRTIFSAVAGTTYRVQLGRGLFGSASSVGIRLEATPAVSASFFHIPFDPSVYDDVAFRDTSFDPVAPGTFEPAAWSFGDGGVATGETVHHRFAADGDYDVTIEARTVDGRTGSTTSTVRVRTHDVAVAKLTVPHAASAGQTRGLTVGLANTRYPEVATVTVLKGLPGGGEELVGSTTTSVPVHPGGRTTAISFVYTFTAADAAMGKVTFKVRVTLAGARDALPADNEATALPTKVH